ncbi:hypothetical protein [Sphingobium ummariense]
MKTLFLVAFMLVAGPYFFWTGIQSLRHGWWRESAPLLEVVIDRTTGVELPPRTAWDRRFALTQAVLNILFGAFFSLCLVAALISTFSE